MWNWLTSLFFKKSSPPQSSSGDAPFSIDNDEIFEGLN